MHEPTPPASFVIGTAGHIDHGKSTLVRALTGTDPDRLAEEKARGMTIDLGFAQLLTPQERPVSIVDVPGHERFIKNMLAGVGGIDAALLVIAADDGPMPQTDEHLAILDLLQVRAGIVVLTKIDLIDRDWLALVEEEVRERIAGTTLAHVPVVPVSAITGEGLSGLLAEIDRMLDSATPRMDRSRPRLPIDRVFTIAGFGTVVTGTLTGGELHVGQALDVLPAGKTTRVRGLQTHSRSVERVQPGNRVAVNLAGLAVADLHRGDVLAQPDLLRPTRRLDAKLHLLQDSPVSLEQNAQVDLFAGAAELPVRLTLLDRDRLVPGETGWVQLRFQQPIAVLKGDRFIVRRPSPSVTIGGGEVIDANPARHRRYRADVIASLETLAAGSPDEIVLQTLEAGPMSLKTLRASLPAGLSDEQVDSALAQLVTESDVLNLSRASLPPDGSDILIAETVWERLSESMQASLQAYHAAMPLRPGMPREELRNRLGLGAPPRLFDELTRFAGQRGFVVDDGATIRLHDFRITLDPVRRAIADRYLADIGAMPYAPPAPAERGVDIDTLGALVHLGEVVKVADGVYYDPAAYREIERGVIDLIDRDGVVTLSSYRDHFQSSRKYAQATLEHLDQRRVTRRVGDERVRYAGAGAGRMDGGTQ